MKTLNKRYIGIKDLEKFINQNNISEHKNILLQIFTGICEIEFIENLVKSIKNLVPHIKILGSTTSGEILEDETFENSTILAFSLFQETTVSTYFTDISSSSYETAKKLISQFDSTLKPKVGITFADGLNINGEEYINAFSDYDKNLIIAGGEAGDNAMFINTIVFTQDKVLVNGAVIALLFSDSLKVTTKAVFGWKSIGKTMSITKATKNIVYEIDNIKVIDIYAKYLGEEIALKLPKTGMEFPLIIAKNKINIPRATIGKNNDGSLVFAGNLYVGDKVRFGYANIHSILEHGANLTDDTEFVKSESIFVYSCMARKALMQDIIKEELLPLSYISDVSGFFTYGEFYHDSNSSKHQLLNQTMTILSLNENSDKNGEPFSFKVLNIPKNTNIDTNINLTQKALSHLIEQTTKELEEINNHLEEKIEFEVKKNRIQDQQLLQQSRLAQMGEMISMIAHQWRQPLAAISSTCIGLNIKANLNTLDNKTVIELTNNISDYAQHLSSTIDDFRNFFKSNKEKITTTIEQIVGNTLEITGTYLENNNIEIITDLNCNVKFETYSNEVKQVVLNLLKNAEDALIDKKIQKAWIKLSSFKEDNSIVLIVSDNAGGVPEDIIDKIFDPYYSTKRKRDGTGLGLYMSQTIIQDHCGGTLSVFNDEAGAVFTIKLPLSLGTNPC